jgi:hypothetical protein
MDVSLLIGGQGEVSWKFKRRRGFSHSNDIERAKVALLKTTT